MLNAMKKAIIITITTSGLIACTTYNPNGYANYQTYDDHGTLLYPEGYESTDSYQDAPRNQKAVFVPESYHVSQYHAPVRPKDVDTSWVMSQNKSHYTIEIAKDNKASYVAKELQKAPKSERRAEVQHNDGSQTMYTGVYGSYQTKEQAEQAFKTLPEELKGQAKIKSWGSIDYNSN